MPSILHYGAFVYTINLNLILIQNKEFPFGSSGGKISKHTRNCTENYGDWANVISPGYGIAVHNYLYAPPQRRLNNSLICVYYILAGCFLSDRALCIEEYSMPTRQFIVTLYTLCTTAQYKIPSRYGNTE